METEATYMAQDADLQKYIRSLKKLKPCTPAEEASLAASIKAGGEDSVEAAKRLVDSHQPLAFSMASRYRGRGIATMDLIQEAILGLYDAVPNFDPSKARFGTYARWWVSNRLRILVNEGAHAVRIPHQSVKKATARLAQAHRARTEAAVNQADVEEVDVSSDVDLEVQTSTEDGGKKRRTRATYKRLGQLQADAVLTQARSGMVALDAPIFEDGKGGTMLDRIVDDNSVDPIEAMAQDEMKGLLAQALSRLDEREKDVLMRRFGVGYDEEETLADVSAKYGISRERVRQIEVSALRKLKNSPEAKGLLSFLS